MLGYSGMVFAILLGSWNNRQEFYARIVEYIRNLERRIDAVGKKEILNKRSQVYL